MYILNPRSAHTHFIPESLGRYTKADPMVLLRQILFYTGSLRWSFINKLTLVGPTPGFTKKIRKFLNSLRYTSHDYEFCLDSVILSYLNVLFMYCNGFLDKSSTCNSLLSSITGLLNKSPNLVATHLSLFLIPTT